VGRSPESPFVRAVKRAFADALVAEIRRTRLDRDDAAKAARVSRAQLQYLLAAKRQTTIATMIALAKGLGIRPEELIARTMEHLDRIGATLEDTEPASEDPVT